MAIAPLGSGSGTGGRMAANALVEPLAEAPDRPFVELFARLGSGDNLAQLLGRSGVVLCRGRRSRAADRFGRSGRRRAGHQPRRSSSARRSPSGIRPIERIAFRAGLDLNVALTAGAERAAACRHQHRGRQPPAAHSRAGRRRPLLGASRLGRLAAGGRRISARARRPARRRRRDRARRPVRPDRRQPPRGDRRKPGRAAALRRDRPRRRARHPADEMEPRRPHRLGRRQWRRPAGRGHGLAGRGPDHVWLWSSLSTRSCTSPGCTAASISAPVMARRSSPPSDGQVVRAGWAGGYGRQVRIAHGGGIVTSYSHMSRIVAEPGSFVRQGQLIGYVGSIGPLDRPAPPLRSLSRRRRGQSDGRQVRQPIDAGRRKPRPLQGEAGAIDGRWSAAKRDVSGRLRTSRA